jgi:hypothetical protein
MSVALSRDSERERGGGGERDGGKGGMEGENSALIMCVSPDECAYHYPYRSHLPLY